MARKADIAALETAIGYAFSDAALLDEALTHPSFAAEANRDNQRLEFLGDRILGLVMAEALLTHDPDAAEGDLAPRLNAMVRKETCAEIAAEVSIGPAMRLGRSEMTSGGRRKMAVLGDAMEALIAAVYLDGGMDASQQMILRLWGARIAHADEQAHDPKTALQEWAQARGQRPPNYAEVSRRGPDHAPLFEIEVQLDSGETARATARSKRAAQQEAAAILLAELEP